MSSKATIPESLGTLMSIMNPGSIILKAVNSEGSKHSEVNSGDCKPLVTGVESFLHSSMLLPPVRFPAGTGVV
jgi:hypothetical protein